MASSPETAKDILQKHDAEFSSRTIPGAVAELKDHDVAVAWIPTGDQWRTIRRAWSTYLVNPQMLERSEGIRQKVVGQMVDHVTEVSKRGVVVDIGKLAFTTALNQMSNTCFSVDVADFKSDEDVNNFQSVIETIMRVDGKINFSDYFPWLKIFDPQGIRRDAKSAYGWLDQRCEKFITQRLKHRESNFPAYGDVLDSLLDFREENQVEFKLKHVKVLLMDVFIAGTESNSSTVEWAMTELIRHPSKLLKLQEEINKKLGGKQRLEEAEILGLPYFQSILKETMRLHLVEPLLLPHKTLTDVNLNGYLTPKNTTVIVNAWAIARNSECWENPNCFSPERFLGSEIDYKGQHFSFLPFGSGRRMCAGIRIAERVVSLMLVALVTQFDWKLPNDMLPEDLDMDDIFGVTLKKAAPLLLMATAIK